MRWLSNGFWALVALVVLGAAPQVILAQAVVPGTGNRLKQVGDDFEDPNWSFNLNLPKSSSEQDKQERLPSGRASNGRFAEGLMRGEPDMIKRVPTPAGGLPGSEGSMLIRSLYTGVPGTFSGQTKQDDLIALVDQRLGGKISPSRTPSVVCRVFLPPFDKWERRAGNSFCFRLSCEAYLQVKDESPSFAKIFFGSASDRVTKYDIYWPGMLIAFNPGDGKNHPDSASLVIRAQTNGSDYRVLQIKEPGWWTLGMTVTPNGQIHYYGHAGVADLTEKDHLASENPYGAKALQFNTFFFDVLNGDNGQWSTPWIVDDAFVYTLR